MNIEFIANIAKKHPALARMLELMVLELALGFVGAAASYLVDDNPINYALIGSAMLSPLALGLQKRKRDLEKQV